MVLTGVNGAGKTHFLTGIANQKILFYNDNELIDNLNTPYCKYVACNTLVPSGSALISPEHKKQTIDGFSVNIILG